MKQFIVTEQEKYNILKQYGLFEQNKTYPYLRPGDKYYAAPTGPFAPPLKGREFYDLTGIEWEDFLIKMYEPRIPIPIPVLGKIEMSVMDIVSIFANFIPIVGPYVSIGLEASSVAYFTSKGNTYEAILRTLFMPISVAQLPIIQKFGKEKLIKLLAKVENLKEDVNLASKLSKEEMKDIVYLFRYFRQNKQAIKLLLSKSAKLTVLMGHITEKLTGKTIAEIMGILYRLYEINPNHSLFLKGSKVLLNLFTQFGIAISISTGWDSFWKKYASDKQKAIKHSYDNQRIHRQTANEIATELFELGKEDLSVEKAINELSNALNKSNTDKNKLITP